MQYLPKAQEKGLPTRQRKLVSLNTIQSSSSLWLPYRNEPSATGALRPMQAGLPVHIHCSRQDTSTTIPKPSATKKHDANLERISEKRVAFDRRVKSTPILHRSVKVSTSSSKLPYSSGEASSSDTEASQHSMSDFIVSDSASESELQKPPRSMRKKVFKPLRRPLRNRRLIVSDDEDEEHSKRKTERDTTTAAETRKGLPSGSLPVLYPGLSGNHVSARSTSSEISKSVEAVPKSGVSREALALHTPPTSPSKPRLQSPSKSRAQIPQSPHRTSIDAFWTQDIINEWNDVFSPQKAQKVKIFPTTGNELLLPGSPVRQSLFSPSSKPKALAQEKRDFDAKKHDLAIKFLADLDRFVTDEQLSHLSADTGGIKIVWSKTLNSTAGRAKWQREAIRTNDTTSNSAKQVTKYKHHASIELAVKVIDNEDRLLNVLAHEFCHLANFMISNVKDQPHGKSFQEWAAKVTSKFPHRNIHVTTKHSYTIDYKYVWSCTECGIEYKRHSKSVDPLRHACSVCKGKLMQTKPVPRNNLNSHGVKSTGRSTYQNFVKKWYASVQLEHQGWKMKDIMSELARRYRAEKEGPGATVTMDPVANKENLKRAQVDFVVVSSEDENDIQDADVLNQRLDHLTLG